MQLKRIFRHLILPHWWVRRVFPPDLLRRIEQAITASESAHRGELRVVVEGNLPLPGLLRGQSARARDRAVLAVACLGHCREQWRPDLPATDRSTSRNRCRSGNRCQGRPGVLGRRLSPDGRRLPRRGFRRRHPACLDGDHRSAANTLPGVGWKSQRVDRRTAAPLAFGVADALARLVRLSQVIEWQYVRLLHRLQGDAGLDAGDSGQA